MTKIMTIYVMLSMIMLTITTTVMMTIAMMMTKIVMITMMIDDDALSGDEQDRGGQVGASCSA